MDEKQWETTLRRDQGFVEIELPASRQRFVMVCLPAWSGEPDLFFPMDGALSWLVTDAPSREMLIRVARRCGIAMVRERLSWAAVHPDRQRRDW